MKRPSDETLMAFADGMLDADEHARIAAYLDGDEDARQLVEAFKLTRDLSAEAFAGDDLGPVPQHLIDTIMQGTADAQPPAADAETRPRKSSPATGASRPRRSKIVDFSARTRHAVAHAARRDLMAIAASVALVVGAVGGYAVSQLKPPAIVAERPSTLAIGSVETSSPVHRLLEEAVTGAPVPLGGRATEKRELVVIGTFKDRAQRFCREFETVDAETRSPLDIAVACRDETGWRVEGAIRLAQPGAGTADTGFEPASGATEPLAIEGLMKMLGADRNLKPDEEQEALESGWRQP